MTKSRTWVSAAGIILLALSGCHSKNEPPAPTSAAEPARDIEQPIAQEPAAVAVTHAPTEAISAARTLLKTGNVDEAAARLAQLRIQGASFNAQQAKDYRQALSEAYDRAIEAAQRGDPKGQAALQLLRAAAPR